VNVVVENDLAKSASTQSLAQSYSLIQEENERCGNIITLKLATKTVSSEYEKLVADLKQDERVKHVLPFFNRGAATPIGTSDIFYLKLKTVNDIATLEALTKEQNIRIVKEVPNMPLWYILSIQNSSFESSVAASNYFYETQKFEEVDPAFMFDFKPSSIPNDPMFSQQWGLKNNSYSDIDINATAAWDITRGAGVKVAVVDQGIDPDHNDLKANFHTLSYDAQSGKSPSVFVSGNTHGTHVAGTVAAVWNNNLQVVGVASEAKIVRVSHDLYLSSTFSAELADGISWAWKNGADVITNSWGDQGGAYYNRMHSTILEQAITDAMTKCRNGLGSFSGYGTKLDVVAPGNNILSTLPNNSTGSKNGTSMATPHVAGIAALVISNNPTLTRLQVVTAIEKSAKKVGSYTYSTTSGRPNGTWNNQMGYGLVDAYAALNSICPVVTFYDQTVTTDCTVQGCRVETKNITVSNGAKLTIIGATNITSFATLKVDSGCKFEIRSK